MSHLTPFLLFKNTSPIIPALKKVSDFGTENLLSFLADVRALSKVVAFSCFFLFF